MFGAFITNELLAMDEQFNNRYPGRPDSTKLNEMTAWIEEVERSELMNEPQLTIPGLKVREILDVGYIYARISSVLYALHIKNFLYLLIAEYDLAVKVAKKETKKETLYRILNEYGINTTNPRDEITIKWCENALKQDRAPDRMRYAKMWHDVLRCEIADGNERGNPQALHRAAFLTEQKEVVEKFLDVLDTTRTVVGPMEGWEYALNTKFSRPKSEEALGTPRTIARPAE